MSEPSSPSPPPDPSAHLGGQPPYGQFGGQFGGQLQPEPPQGTFGAGQSASQSTPVPATQYPHQQLLPQEVKPRRSRLPQIIGLVVVLALVAGGLAAWFLLRDDGEDTRAEYCAAFQAFLGDGDLLGVLASADQSTLTQLEKLAELAPTVVDAAWQRLQDLVDAGELSITGFAAAYSAGQSIVRDAEDNCGMDIPLPGL